MTTSNCYDGPHYNDTTNNHNLLDNSILRALPSEEYQRLLPHLEEVEMPLGEVLSRPGEEIRYAYFPLEGAISIVVMMEDGSEAEAGVVGREGMSGIPIAFGTNAAPFQSMVQMPGRALRIKAEALRAEVRKYGALHDLILCYAQAFFVQTGQTAACNRLHKLDGRFAKWLLMCQDRASGERLELTHDFIATMLGVRRSGVSVAANQLQSEGLISYRRGHVNILDRDGLEAVACECYGVVRREFDRLL